MQFQEGSSQQKIKNKKQKQTNKQKNPTLRNKKDIK